MDAYKVWEIGSYAWTEIGIEENQCERLAAAGRITVADLKEVDRILFSDVCASFAVDSFLMIPLMFWMIMPDWGYGESYLRRRMNRWYARSYWSHFINPLRWLGYSVALISVWKYWSMLHRVVKRSSESN